MDELKFIQDKFSGEYLALLQNGDQHRVKEKVVDPEQDKCKAGAKETCVKQIS